MDTVMRSCVWARKAFRANTKDIDPSDVADVCDEIMERDGQIRPAAVVDAARPKKSPIHEAFTWDDFEAAEQYRLEQARELIVIVHVETPDEGPSVPVYVNVLPENGRTSERAYQTTVSVEGDEARIGRIIADYEARVRQAMASLEQVRAALGQGSDQKIAKVMGYLMKAAEEGRSLAA